MDVSTITNNIPIPKVNINNNIDLPQTDLADTIIQSNSIQFDYSKVMMNLEEVQEFLFMLIGQESPAKAAKGSKVNLLA